MLTPAQAAFLAGLPQRPSGFNPYRRPAAALARQRRVLGRMEAAGCSTAEQAPRGARRAAARSRATRRAFVAPHFVEMVLDVGGRRGRRRIETTLDAELQAEVARHHREPARPARAARRRERGGGRARQRARRVAGVGRIGRLLRRRARRRDQRPSCAAAAGIRAQAVHLRAGVRARLHAGDGAARRPLALSRRRSRASSTARGTTTDGIAARCWRVARWPDPRTCPRSRSRRELGVPDAAALPRPRRAHHVRPAPRPTTGSASRWATPRCGSIELVAAYAAFARGGVWRDAEPHLPLTARSRRAREQAERARRRRADGVLDHRHPARSPRRARTSSAAAAASSSRSRSR